MGEAPVTGDYAVTRSAEVTLIFPFSFLCSLLLCFLPELLFLAVKYVGSFTVDDCCLDEQIEQLHTHMKLFKVSPHSDVGSQFYFLLKQHLTPMLNAEYST